MYPTSKENTSCRLKFKKVGNAYYPFSLQTWTIYLPVKLAAFVFPIWPVISNAHVRLSQAQSGLLIFWRVAIAIELVNQHFNYLFKSSTFRFLYAGVGVKLFKKCWWVMRLKSVRSDYLNCTENFGCLAWSSSCYWQ